MIIIETPEQIKLRCRRAQAHRELYGKNWCYPDGRANVGDAIALVRSLDRELALKAKRKAPRRLPSKQRGAAPPRSSTAGEARKAV